MNMLINFILTLLIILFADISVQADILTQADLADMTLREKVGQLFIIPPDQLDTSRSLKDINDSKALKTGSKNLTDLMLKTLNEYPAGGFIIFNKNLESPKQLKILMGDLKGACKITPVMAIDEEGGRIARLANHENFNLKKFESMEAIGRTGDAAQAFAAAKIIGGYIKEYGFTMNFAPVADVNTNPENIVIGDRAFGSEPKLVSKMAGAYLDGLHAQKIAGSLKHFPGHGDTSKDTHLGLVAVYKTWDELLKAELIPFIDNLNKADSVMAAHITLENITSGLPATLSHELITKKLRGELGYDGIIITDALIMGAIADNYSSGEAALLALEAGNDILLMPYDYIEAFNAILNAVKTGRISEKRIDESVTRILKLKAKYNY